MALLNKNHTPEWNAAAACSSRLFEARVHAKQLRAGRRGPFTKSQRELIEKIEEALEIIKQHMNYLDDTNMVYKENK